MRRANRVRKNGAMVDVLECRWWRHTWKESPVIGFFCTTCGKRRDGRAPIGDPPTDPPPRFHGINIVHDGPAANVPEPGGLPSAEPICVARGERSGGLWVFPDTPKIVPPRPPTGARPPGTYR